MRIKNISDEALPLVGLPGESLAPGEEREIEDSLFYYMTQPRFDDKYAGKIAPVVEAEDEPEPQSRKELVMDVFLGMTTEELEDEDIMTQEDGPKLSWLKAKSGVDDLSATERNEWWAEFNGE